MIVDGTLIACDRVAADRPFYSGKHKRHGMNIQVVAAPNGEPLWTSWSLLGLVHDTRAARVWKIAERIKASGLLGLGDKGYVGLSQVVFCPFKGRGKPRWKKDPNSEHAKLRGPGERAFAQLKNWDVLRRLRCCPHRVGEITRAVLVLQLREAGWKRLSEEVEEKVISVELREPRKAMDRELWTGPSASRTVRTGYGA